MDNLYYKKTGGEEFDQLPQAKVSREAASQCTQSVFAFSERAWSIPTRNQPDRSGLRTKVGTSLEHIGNQVYQVGYIRLVAIAVDIG